jgi:hypothetical protein
VDEVRFITEPVRDAPKSPLISKSSALFVGSVDGTDGVEGWEESLEGGESSNGRRGRGRRSSEDSVIAVGQIDLEDEKGKTGRFRYVTASA